MMSTALEGIKVIDLTSVLAGPFCTMMLGDAGADVIKVESPTGDQARTWGPPFWGDQGAEFLAVNRNKRSIVLDLKNPEARDVLFDLCKTADIFVENYRRGVPERLGIDYESIRKVNPRIIYCSISGFGDSGPRREQAAYDSVMQAFVGIMHMTGAPGAPPTRASVSVCDMGAAMYANQAILLAASASRLRCSNRRSRGWRFARSVTSQPAKCRAANSAPRPPTSRLIRSIPPQTAI